MTLDPASLKKCIAKAEQVILMEQQAEQAKIEFHAEIRRLHLKGGSYREIGAALGLSHQRISQIVNGDSSNWIKRWVGKHDSVPKPLNCSFCGQSQHRVNKLVAGPKVFICDECVDHSLALFSDTAPEGIHKFLSVQDNEAARCSFCGDKQKGERKFVGANIVRICRPCLSLAEESMEREWVDGEWKYKYQETENDSA